MIHFDSMNKQAILLFLDRVRRYALSPKAVVNTFANIIHARVIRQSRFFDPEFYLEQCPELKQTGEDPALHYLFCGHVAGFNPGPNFVGAEYLELNPEAKKQGVNPLLHFEKKGKHSGARISLLQQPNQSYQDFKYPTIEEHQASFSEKFDSIKRKFAKGQKIDVVFFVTSMALFPSKPLFDLMLKDNRFSPRIAVVPDLRGLGNDVEATMAACEKKVVERSGEASLLKLRPDADGIWPEVSADIIVYPLPQNYSYFKYNPQFSVGRAFVPIFANYGYPSTKFAVEVLSHYNYAYFCKVFLESQDVLDIYKSGSLINGTNGVVTGYIKMDELAKYEYKATGRKRILIALHHSVEGGANRILELSNFIRYAEFFKALPKRYPTVDFVFRPHPFLFPVLSRPKHWGKERVERYLSEIKAYPNAFWSEGSEYLEEFALADAIVQDCASFLVEWFYTGKPCCYMLKQESDIEGKFLPVGQKCLHASHIAYNQEQIQAFVDSIVGEKIISSSDALVAKQAVSVNYPNAAQKALDELLKCFIEEK